MLPITTNHITSTAPAMRPRSESRMTAPCGGAVPSGENRLASGLAVNGFGITGLEAHAAVCMHVDPATATPWTYVQKAKATTSSAGRLRRS